MAIGYIKRVAGPFTGAGKTELPFGFMIFNATDVYVALAESDTAQAKNLVYGTDYTVTVNDDQETTPGGTVTLTTALTDGQVVAVGSALDYTQPTQLTNFSRFPPEIINDALDRIVILIQQIIEKLERTVEVPVTSIQTPEELIATLQHAADSAEKVASAYAEQAGASASQSSDYASLAKEWATKTDGKVEDVDYSAKYYAADAKTTADNLPAKEQALESELVAFTDTQIERIQNESDDVLVVNATGCAEKQWTLTADIAAGTAITIPSGIYYVVGRHHLRVSYNGLVCYLETNFNEIGTTDTKSNQFSLTFDAKSGDEIDVWVAALGKADVASAITTATAANDAVAELSQKVVYKDETSSSS